MRGFLLIFITVYVRCLGTIAEKKSREIYTKRLLNHDVMSRFVIYEQTDEGLVLKSRSNVFGVNEMFAMPKELCFSNGTL